MKFWKKRKTRPNTPRLVSLKKEATLFFLAGFYFVIATNTQTGWLFVLSAFLLGVLAISWTLSRRSIKSLHAARRFFGEPQRGRPMRIEVSLHNNNSGAVHEVRVEAPSPEWAAGETPKFEWATPRLEPAQKCSKHHTLIPVVRGEHRLPPLSIITGAPFGLFSMTKTLPQEKPFLIYPEIEKLPPLRTLSRSATALGDAISPQGLGDTHSLRSVREYRPGDDLRHVHWKASAKLGPGAPLMVAEHHAPAPNRTLLFLDTSGEGAAEGLHRNFERAVVLAASILWAAAREGTTAGLAVRKPDGDWSVHVNWPRQYRALAEVQLHRDLSPAGWCREAEELFHRGLPRGFRSCRPYLVKGSIAGEALPSWPRWIERLFLLRGSNDETPLPNFSALTVIDSSKERFTDV